LEELQIIQNRRKEIGNEYNRGLKEWAEKNKIGLPKIPDFATNNAHMFYMVCNTPDQRKEVIRSLKEKNIHAVFHYLSLYKSPF